MGFVSWAYVAGLFDGEGNVHVQTGGRAISAKFSISQSGKAGEELFAILLPWLREQGIKCYLHGYEVRDGRFQKKWTISAHTRTAVRRFLSGVLPYLIVKKVTWQDILRFLRAFPKLSSATRTDGKTRWNKRVALYGPTGNRCGLYSKQIKKESK